MTRARESNPVVNDRCDPGSLGFLVHVYHHQNRERFAVVAVGKLDSGETFQFVDDRQRPAFYICLSDLDVVRRLTGSTQLTIEPVDWTTMDGRVVARVSSPNLSALRSFADLLKDKGIRTYEADVSSARQYLMNCSLRGSVLIEGQWQPGDGIDRAYYNPKIAPAVWEPELAVLALDIETDAQATQVFAVSLAGSGPHPKHNPEEIHLVGEPSEIDPPNAICYADEAALLEGLAQRLKQIDPDILTGWNVIDFDLSVLQKRFNALDISRSLGRTDGQSFYRGGDAWGGSRMTIPGRQVVDAMRLARAIPRRFEDYRLSTVAREILGRDKTLEAGDDQAMPEVIQRAYDEDRKAFCEYCLEDSRLVRDILASEGLIEMTLRRSLLTGLPLDNAWGSVAPFDFLYISKLHERRVVAPTLGVDQPEGGSAPGGLVMAPHPGLHKHIFVFDFKSLYPSIIRTFNIDPLAHIRASQSENGDLITAPNGATFLREPGILPAMLEQLFASRDQAIAAGDELASFTYKILMNSFYGVLGTTSCRFASPDLAGAITEFGHYILRWTRDLLKSDGARVLYGDTDSLFVDASLSDDINYFQAVSKGHRLRDWINRKLAEHVKERYGLESHLELEFEKYYRRFLLPFSRGDKARARAKGYAGLRVGPDTEGLDIIGMEAVRRDWTDLAHDLQRDLLDRLFHNAPPDEIEQCVGNWIRAVRNGQKDGALIYRKGLRKQVDAYTKSSPPHVKAARQLPNPRGLIHYLVTSEGPQPVGYVTAPIDYDHYIQKQIKPIVQTIAQVCEIDLNSAMAGEPNLFTRGRSEDLDDSSVG